MSRQPEAASSGKPGLFYGWYLVAVSWMMLFLGNAVSMGIFFKPILDEFGWSRATLSLVQMVSTLISAVLTPFIGRLIDKVGPRFMLFVSTAAQAVSSVLTGLASGITHVYAGRILAEVKPMSAAQVLINRWFLKKRGRAQGIVATGMPVGTFALIPLSQYLILTWGWRPTLLFWAGVIFTVMLILTWFVRDKPEDRGTAADGVPLEAAPINPRFASGAVSTGVERGNTLAEAVRTGAFWLTTSTHIICGIGCGFMMTHIVIFATDVGYSEMIGATFLSIQGAFNLAGVLLIGYLSDRIVRNKALSLTHFIRSLSFVIIIFSFISGSPSLWMLYLAMALFGIGWFTTAPLVAGLVADLFGYRRMGTIMGAITAGHLVGVAVGIYGGGIVFEITNSYYRFFLVQGCLEFLAAVLAFSIRRKAAF